MIETVKIVGMMAFNFPDHLRVSFSRMLSTAFLRHVKALNNHQSDIYWRIWCCRKRENLLIWLITDLISGIESKKSLTLGRENQKWWNANMFLGFKNNYYAGAPVNFLLTMCRCWYKSMSIIKNYVSTTACLTHRVCCQTTGLNAELVWFLHLSCPC